MARTTTEESGRLLAKHGYMHGLVERYVARTKRRYDFCGFGDIIAFRVVLGEDVGGALFDWWAGSEATGKAMDFRGCLAVQSTTANHVGDHVADVVEVDYKRDKLFQWLEAGNRFEIWGWSKKGPRGQKKVYRPTVRRFVVSAGELWTYENTELEAFGYGSSQ